jgi:oligoribonuclease NrnB/cAMP/cGMP phosphodiesterase (DHH superfamily)
MMQSRYNMSDLSKIKEVYFHDSCPDGTSSALICKTALQYSGVSAEYIPIQYGSKRHNELVPAEGQLFVDITPPLKRWEEWIPYKPIVLDHHETAEKAVKGLNGIYGTNDNYSGAMLAFEYIYAPILGVPYVWKAFAELCMIRDTWKTEDPRWVEASKLSFGLTGIGWDKLKDVCGVGFFNSREYTSVLNSGAVIHDMLKSKCDSILKGCHTIDKTLDDKHITLSFFNFTDRNVSDVCHHLLNNGSDIVFSYFIKHSYDGHEINFSVRSKDPFSASKLAEKFGGGGHKNAAGFRIKLDDDNVFNNVFECIYQEIDDSIVVL